MNRVLLIEDDPKLSSLIARSLESEFFEVKLVATPEGVKDVLRQGEFSLVILDRLLASFDTKMILPEIQAQWPQTLILVISTINTPLERAELINHGADDYLGKPFLTEELIARARSLTRRSPKAKDPKRKIGKALFDLTDRRLFLEGKFENLPTREFMILNVLSEHPGKVISRPELLEAVWGNINHSETNLVEATIANLRRRIASLGCDFKIKNQRNIGYWLEG